MVQEWVWGDIPAGFRRFCPNRMQTVLVREGLEICLDPQRISSQAAMVREATVFYGRGKLLLFHLGDGGAALVRAYRHGGVFRQLTGEIFFTWPPRPFRELAITVEARRRGVPTLEILGAWIERVWGPFYRGCLITRELKGANDLWAALQSGDYSGSEGMPLLQAVARSVKTMHHRGVYHGDLNLKNILVRREGDAIKSYLIDFDKARLFSGDVPAESAQRNLRRLLRSICKLDPDRRLFSHEDWDLLIRFYREAAAG